jgi:hypothetical protein
MVVDHIDTNLFQYCLRKTSSKEARPRIWQNGSATSIWLGHKILVISGLMKWLGLYAKVMSRAALSRMDKARYNRVPCTDGDILVEVASTLHCIQYPDISGCKYANIPGGIGTVPYTLHRETKSWGL